MSLAAGYAAMAADAQMHAVQRRAERDLRTAEHHHGRTIALLVAAFAELRRLDPSNPLHVPHVQERIRDWGGYTIDRSKSFQPVWDLEFDPAAILRMVQEEHEAAKAATVASLELAKVETKRCFFRPWLTYARVLGVKFPSAELAHAARLRALAAASCAQLGDDLDVNRLLRNA
ncbi:hypothetical protein [Rhodoferax sp.]|uniref:hypothetical protein n=1 Tax=Rhodoferax sp. TaxID=50421 RepID=UPI0027572D41|nr:hypothetical protein [Rhodoferax sp.]